MNFDVTPAWAKLQGIVHGLITMLPNLLLAVITLAFFAFVAKSSRRLIESFCNRKGHQHSVGLVIGRLGSALIVLLGLLVSLSIILPSFKAADLIQVLGLGSVAAGFALRDVLQNFLAGILILLAQPFSRWRRDRRGRLRRSGQRHSNARHLDQNVGWIFGGHSECDDLHADDYGLQCQ